MKRMIFNNYPDTMRKNIVVFSSLYKRMVDEIKTKLIGKTSISLFLGRISDTGISVTPSPVDFFNISQPAEDMIVVSYYGDHYDSQDRKIPIEKTIRFDNPFGEIPILPGYEQIPKFFVIGEELEQYRKFISEVREGLPNYVGQDIQLCYQNDNGSVSVIEGTLREVNRGNIFMDDYQEFLVIDNKSIKVDLLVNRKKNHRFISEAGYLFELCSTTFNKKNMHDEGEIFGQEKTWRFLQPQIVG